MEFLEKNLEDILFESLKDDKKYNFINERGLYVTKPYLLKRQFSIGNYGTCDLIALNRPYELKTDQGYIVEKEPVIITIYELKQNKIDLNSLLQIMRYMKGVKRWMYKNKSCNYKIRGVLIGNSINTSNYVYLFDYFQDHLDTELGEISVYTYNYKFDGIEFENIDLSQYILVDEGF